MTEPRVRVVSPHLHFPTEKELEARFRAALLKILRRLAPLTDKLDHRQESKVRHIARRTYDRRLSASGLSWMKNEPRDRIMALARSGARIVGPTTLHEVDEWAALVHDATPWMSDLTARLMKHMRARMCAAEPGFSIPPLLLVGEPGNGKSWYAHEIGSLVGAPIREIDVGGGSAAFRIAGMEKGWSSSSVGIPVETILQHRVANPVMVVNEVCKAAQHISSTSGSVSSLTTALLQMLEPETARRFECPSVRVQFDMSRVSWILTANDLYQVPAPLRDRCLVFKMPEVTPAVAGLMFDTLSRKYDHTIDQEAYDMGRVSVIAAASRRHVSLRQIRRVLETLADTTPEILH